MKKRKHIRSYSCDVKIDRSNSRELDPEYRNRRINNYRSHSRNNSRDLDFDGKPKSHPTHSRTSSRDEPINIKYIFNCIKPEGMLTLPPPVNSRKHSRNHSYDQIYSMPNNIKFDPDLNNKCIKNRKKSITTSIVPINTNLIDNDLRKQNSIGNEITENVSNLPTTMSHSRNNSKDLNKSNFLTALVDDATNNILRHRRTNSKDLNRLLATPSTSTNFVTASSDSITLPTTSQQHQPQHRHNLSQTEIEFPEEDSQYDNGSVSASDVLLHSNEHNDNQNQSNSAA